MIKSKKAHKKEKQVKDELYEYDEVEESERSPEIERSDIDNDLNGSGNIINDNHHPYLNILRDTSVGFKGIQSSIKDLKETVLFAHDEISKKQDEHFDRIISELKNQFQRNRGYMDGRSRQTEQHRRQLDNQYKDTLKRIENNQEANASKVTTDLLDIKNYIFYQELKRGITTVASFVFILLISIIISYCMKSSSWTHTVSNGTSIAASIKEDILLEPTLPISETSFPQPTVLSNIEMMDLKIPVYFHNIAEMEDKYLLLQILTMVGSANYPEVSFQMKSKAIDNEKSNISFYVCTSAGHTRPEEHQGLPPIEQLKRDLNSENVIVILMEYDPTDAIKIPPGSGIRVGNTFKDFQLKVKLSVYDEKVRNKEEVQKDLEEVLSIVKSW